MGFSDAGIMTDIIKYYYWQKMVPQLNYIWLANKQTLLEIELMMNKMDT